MHSNGGADGSRDDWNVVTPAWLRRNRNALGIDFGEQWTLAVIMSFNGRGECFPGQERIAERAGATRRTVQRHCGKLEALGLIERVRREGRRATYFYTWEGLAEAVARLDGVAPSGDNSVATGEATTVSPLADPRGDNSVAFEATTVSPREATTVSHEVVREVVQGIEKGDAPEIDDQEGGGEVVSAELVPTRPNGNGSDEGVVLPDWDYGSCHRCRRVGTSYLVRVGDELLCRDCRRPPVVEEPEEEATPEQQAAWREFCESKEG